MGVSITYPGTLPSLNDPATFNERALNLLAWITGQGSNQLLGQLADMDANDFFSVIQSSEDTESGRLLAAGPDGYLGYFGTGDLAVVSDADTIDRARRYRWDSDTTGIAASMGSVGVIETYRRASGTGVQRRYQIGMSGNGLFFRPETSAGFREQDWAQFWSTGNTTVDGSGFILEASPIVRIYTDEISEPAQPVGATLSHPATGHYVLTGVPPLATKGWRAKPAEGTVLGTPRWVGDALHVHVYDQSGAPVDVPEGAFALLRFWSGDDDEQPPEVESLSAAEGEAALLAERRELRRLTRAEFIVAAMAAGVVSEADAEAAATGAWPAGFDAFLTGLPVADRIAAKAGWVDGGTVRRSHPIIAQIAETMDLSDEALDQMFGIG
ncbi:MAG: hypothetical protein ACLFRZ_09455 [Rhodosalinus sp.]